MASDATALPLDPPTPVSALERTTLPIILALGISHLLNDVIQSLLPAIYPMLKVNYDLSFTQIGLITFTFQGTASLLQPVVGLYTDRRPKPYSLAIGMGISLVGLILLSRADHYGTILFSAALVGMGSSIFHPEASRIAHMAAGQRHGLAQSLFQVGGNVGTSLGPLAAALIIVPRGQPALLWFTILAAVGMAVLTRVGVWYQRHLASHLARVRSHQRAAAGRFSRSRIIASLGVLIALIFSKYFYLVSFTNYYTFYLIERFHVSVQGAQFYLFIFLFAAAAGTILGGPLGDRFGRKYVIWFSILGVAPFSLVLPHVGLVATVGLAAVVGAILASAFSAILVYAQELIPGKIGLIAGLFFGLAFGMSAIASAALGHLADHAGIEHVFFLCGFLPLIGLLTVFLPDVRKRPRSAIRG
ncbi:MFS transporter [Opitutus terrae]|uniref:Major facilitator superfamily MFS_1 n=1 Tax=Opitutus terrae (strain DSM 11246 / JCM 15787 / PB90-1) TaxID=452637 RepID=B1ZZ39_OPITP|nr:MFS transporter [Opitutus terrae]ACB77111.1 major facilitator superfamily MFS_1 [Opitutus terrae PB90-1]